jgi:hypothetical protein
MLSEQALAWLERSGLPHVAITYEAAMAGSIDVAYRLACSGCPFETWQLNEPFADQSLPHFHARDGGPVVQVVAGYELPL